VPPRPGKAWFPGVPTPLVRDFVAPEEQSPKCNFEQLFSERGGHDNPLALRAGPPVADVVSASEIK